MASPLSIILIILGIKHLNGANLNEADLIGASLIGADLIGASLIGADLNRADLNGANLNIANLVAVNFSEASLIRASLIGADLIGANLIGANLNRADLSRAELIAANLNGANLREADLSGANLREADLSRAELIAANLNGANLSRAELIAANLNGADLSRTNLSRADLSRTNLSRVDLREANLSGANLSGANLSGANLSRADLREANLRKTSLSRADLSKAMLNRSQALNTNLKEVIFTGACIEDWNINIKTNLKNIRCDYIFFNSIWNEQEKKDEFTERRPHQTDKDFEPGDFERLVRKSQETIDLIFRNGIDWQAFLKSYEQLKVEAGGDFFPVQSIENRDDGSFIVKLKSPIGTDKEATEKFFEERYQQELKIIEEKYRIQLEAKEEIIEIHKKQNTDILELAKLAASQPINVAMTNNNLETFHNNQQGANIANNANIVKDNARQQAKQYNYAPEQKQSLAEAAAEIQQLLDQLSQTYSPEEAEQKVAEDLANKAKQDPSFKEKLKSWSLSITGKGAETAVVESIKEGVKRVIPLAITLLV
ncbi:MAG: pentapeptide repeat-containing protein [Microcoleaceae cyanobacterium]